MDHTDARIEYARQMAARGQRDWIVLERRIAPLDDFYLQHLVRHVLESEAWLIRPTGLAQWIGEAILTWKTKFGFLVGPAVRIADIDPGAEVVPECYVSGMYVWVNQGERAVLSRWA